MTFLIDTLFLKKKSIESAFISLSLFPRDIKIKKENNLFQRIITLSTPFRNNFNLRTFSLYQDGW